MNEWYLFHTKILQSFCITSNIAFANMSIYYSKSIAYIGNMLQCGAITNSMIFLSLYWRDRNRKNIGKGKINRDSIKIRKENKTKIITTTKREQVIAKYN